jgi:hypothetical protein
MFGRMSTSTTESSTGPAVLTPLDAPPRADHAVAPVGPALAPQSLGRRLIERFALLAFALYHLPLFLNNYATLGGGGISQTGLAISWGHLFTPPGVWVARHVLGVTGPMPNAYAGDNGDVGEEFGRLLIAVVIGALVTACWTMADRKRPRSRWTGDALQVLLRYSIALGLASYAIAKILPVQFPAMEPLTLEQRVGDLTPIALLWTFMGYSRPYAFFGGLMELLAVLLLCTRRTATLGAFICVAVMTNVAMMNYAYGVPVKLYATMVVLSAAVLLIYDAPRLVAAFLRSRTPLPAPRLSSWQDRIPTPLRWTAKGLLLGSVLLSSVVGLRAAVNQPAPSTAIGGLWIVTSFAQDGQAPDTSRWSQVFVGGKDLGLGLATHRFIWCQTTPGSTPNAVVAMCSQNRRVALHWDTSGRTVQIDGTFNGTRVTASARRAEKSDYRLMQAKFRLITD